jgi:hypothetical protein
MGKTTTLCLCCERQIPTDEPKGKCWECRGRPPVSSYVITPPGERAEKCPHAFPATRELQA